MLRRIPDYAVNFDWEQVSIGGFGFGLSQILFAILIIKSMRQRQLASGRGRRDAARPWRTPPSLPFHTFTTPPDLPEQVHL